MSNPVRIYVLHHPGSKLAARLADRIYEWFRLPSLEGIPVYVRSVEAAPGKGRPLLPHGSPADDAVQYFVPLVDAHLVRDPAWHDYLAEIAGMCDTSEEASPPEWGWRMIPVALDSTAFNLPEAISRLNFIRFGTSPPPKPSVPGQPTPEEKEARMAWEEAESGEMLKHLTEALARDLNGRLFPQQKESRFQVFISYARADSTEEAKALRNYIQGQTQCLVFFDENDIGFGHAFGESLERSAGEHSKALIVINSDHYAERPWCRWEIDRFSEPRPLKLAAGSHIHVFHPLLVVDKMAGPKISRVVPELGQAPMVRWAAGREPIIFTSLMREVVMGLRDVLVARVLKWPAKLENELVVNRLPGPVTLAKLLREETAYEKGQNVVIHHPGHGLPFTELHLLKKTFPKADFHAFRDITRNLTQEMKDAFMQMERAPQSAAPLRNSVIALSTAHHRADLAALGYLPQHQDEALIHLLRPLLRLGADLMYGGRPPKHDMEAADDNLAERNITLTLMRLLSTERRVELPDPRAKKSVASPAGPGPLLFNVSSWPACDRITEVDEAAWINVCRVKRVHPKDARLPAWIGLPPKEKEKDLPQGFRRHLALTMSRMREMLAQGFPCQVPGQPAREVRPSAFVFIGGALDVFKGIMPGVFEEFLHAVIARPRVPIYLVGGLGGATRIIADALLAGGSAPPKELTQDHYSNALAPNAAEYVALLAELTPAERKRVAKSFQELWRVIRRGHGTSGISRLLDNGLNDEDNRKLLSTDHTITAVTLIWKGMSRKFLATKAAKPSSRSRTTSKPKPSPAKRRR